MEGGMKYDSDFYEDGSFMVLRDDTLSTPPNEVVASVNDAEQPASSSLTLAGTSVNTVAAEVDTKNSIEGSNEGNVAEMSVSLVTESTQDQPNGSKLNKDLDVDFFSLTSFSIPSASGIQTVPAVGSGTENSFTSISSADTEDNQVNTINKLVADNLSLKESMANLNEEMQKNLGIFEQQKLAFKFQAEQEKLKFEGCQQRIESLKQENTELEKTIAELRLQLAAVPVPSHPNDSEIKKLENLENMLSEKDSLIIQKDRQLQELSRHAEASKSEIVYLRQTLHGTDAKLKQQEAKLKQNTDSLSQSDEALARILAKKDTLESEIEHFKKESDRLKSHVAAVDNENTVLKQHLEEARSNAQAHERLRRDHAELLLTLSMQENELKERITQNERMEIELAARKAEHDKEIERYRYNFEEEIAEKNRMKCELQALKEENDAVKATLHEMTNEIEGMRGCAPNATASALPERAARDASTTNFTDEINKSPSPSLTSIPGHVYDVLKRGFTQLGYGESTGSSSGQDSFEHVLNQPAVGISNAQEEAIQPCPICRRRFDSVKKLERHAANCCEELATRTDPFVFP